MAEKVYLKCSAKQKTAKFGPILTLGVRVADLLEFAEKHKNERGYLNLVISERKTPGQYGDTHSVCLDDYTPKPKASTEDVPF
jgi:hypothetical protein